MNYFYTNYPDNVPRKIVLLAYDRNKYCKYAQVDDLNTILECKAGYIYKDAAFKKGVGSRILYRLPNSCEEKGPPTIKVEKALKKIRKTKTTYILAPLDLTFFEKDAQKRFSSLRLALNAFFKEKNACELVRSTSRRYTSRVESLIEKDDKGNVCLFELKNKRAVLKRSHLNRK